MPETHSEQFNVFFRTEFNSCMHTLLWYATTGDSHTGAFFENNAQEVYLAEASLNDCWKVCQSSDSFYVLIQLSWHAVANTALLTLIQIP